MEYTINAVHTTESCNKSLNAIGDAVYVIGGKWNLRVLVTLRDGQKRFNELQRLIAGISPRVLSNELKKLEQNGLVMRKTNSENTLTEYSLTPYSDTLNPLLYALHDWGMMHREKVRAV